MAIDSESVDGMLEHSLMIDPYGKYGEEYYQHLLCYHTFFQYPVPINVELINYHAKLPSKGYASDQDHINVNEFDHIFNLGWDIFVVPDEDWKDGAYILQPQSSHTFSTGIKVATNPNYGFLLRDRSKYGVRDISVEAGVIEGTYRGEWKVHLINHGFEPYEFKTGDKLVQAVLVPIIPARIKAVPNLDDTVRSEKGFGSSGG